MLYLFFRCVIIMLNCKMFMVLIIRLLLEMGWNICIVFFLESCISFFSSCFCLSGFFRWIWWNSFGVKFGILVNFIILFWVKVLLIWMVLWLCRFKILFGYVFLMCEWLFVIKVNVLEIIIFLLVWIWCSFMFFLYLLEIMCINVMWLWCFGFILVWILKIKLVNFFFEVFIVWVLVWCGIGVGVYVIKLFSIWLMLKLFSVVLKNIGVIFFVRNSFLLNLLDVFCISFSLLCSCCVRFLLMVVFRFGLFSFLMMCIFWMVWFLLVWYR